MIAICCSLGFASCVVPQSMVILKPPRIGGAVLPHVDGCFLFTVPQTVVGLWWPLEDCTESNGCLWVVPGSHAAGVGARYKSLSEEQYAPPAPPIRLREGAPRDARAPQTP